MRSIIRTSDDIRRFAAKIESKLDGKPYQIDIRPFKQPKSGEQRAVFHILVRKLALLCGSSDDELKSWFKAMYGPSKEVSFNRSKPFVIPVSSEDWSMEQSGTMIEHVYRVAAENGHDI